MPSDADKFGDEGDRAVMSAESVDAAAGTARAQVTYQYLEPADPGHPLPDGGFWGAFTRSLAGRWEQIKANADPTTGTFEDDEAEGQTQLVTDGGREQTGDEADREPRDGESYDGAGHVRPVPAGVPMTPEEDR